MNFAIRDDRVEDAERLLSDISPSERAQTRVAIRYRDVVAFCRFHRRESSGGDDTETDDETARRRSSICATESTPPGNRSK